MKYLLAFLLLAFSAYAESVRFEFKNDSVNFRIHDKDYGLKSEDFTYVLDWSDDYTRENFGTGEKKGRFFVFKGFLNGDRQIVFIYDLKSQKLSSVGNGGGVIVDNKLGWAALQYDPHFAEQSGFTSIILNGDEVGRIDSSKLSGLEWTHGTLRILVAPNTKK